MSTQQIRHDSLHKTVPAQTATYLSLQYSRYLARYLGTVIIIITWAERVSGLPVSVQYGTSTIDGGTRFRPALIIFVRYMLQRQVGTNSRTIETTNGDRTDRHTQTHADICKYSRI